ncbi:hypothetical protein ROA7450_03372 [Roseovarius albus]|uniref:Uncharacterized protein n=1 Tax=Roseovarius albus TaxID=1247867 RepID=A0A1X6ZXM5_9RHOB|nr:hypothetical protein [Roseovarius albus]SLN64028.1 hypothetical protein ROA7450_03372 [Roseovarius albus]
MTDWASMILGDTPQQPAQGAQPYDYASEILDGKPPQPVSKPVEGKEVIATTEDGGQVFKLSNGQLAFKSPGYATNDQERIAEIMKGAKPVDLVQRDVDQERIAANPVAARVQEFNQGAPLVGEWLDEAVGMVSPEAAKNMNLMSDAMERQHPVQSAALNIAGGITTAAPLAVAGGGTKATDFVAKGANTLTRGARAGMIAAPAGAVEGAASFAGRADEGERLGEAGKGALVGGGLGLGLGPIASMLGEGVTTMAKKIKRLDIHTIADEFGVSVPAARAVKQALMNDDLGAASARLTQLGDDAMLADAGPATQALLDAASKTGGKALKVARDAATERSDAIGKRLPRKLDMILGKPQGIKETAKGISQATAPARQKAFDTAFNSPIDYSAKAGRDIEAVLERVPPKTLQKAVSEANEAMIEKGQRNQQILAEIGDDGAVAFKPMPNTRQLHEIKMALDTIGREAVDQFGRPNAQGTRARRLAGGLRDALKKAVPTYTRALKIGGDKIQQDEGLALGKDLLFKRTTVEDVRDFLKSGTSVESRNAMKIGLRNSIEETLSNVRRTISDPDVDGREAMQLVKEISSRANQAKVKMVLGEGKANHLLTELDRTATALQLRGAISRNSDTAIRQSIQGQVTEEATPGVVKRTLGKGGNPFEAAKQVTESIAGIDPRTMNAQEKAIFDEIAQALVGKKDKEAREALFAVRRALSGQPIKDEQAQLIGRVVAGSGGLALYQQGKRALASQ